jgi:hypothetical protein
MKLGDPARHVSPNRGDQEDLNSTASYSCRVRESGRRENDRVGGVLCAVSELELTS